MDNNVNAGTEEKEKGVDTMGESNETMNSSPQDQAPAPVEAHAHANIAYMVAAMRRGAQEHNSVSTENRGQDFTAAAEENPGHDSLVYSSDEKANRVESSPKLTPPLAATKSSRRYRVAAQEDGKKGKGKERAIVRQSPRDVDMTFEEGGRDVETPGSFDLSYMDSTSLDEEEEENVPCYSVRQSATADDDHMPGAHYIGGDQAISFGIEVADVDAAPTSEGPNLETLVAAHLVDTEEEGRRIQQLEEQNRTLRERERNITTAQVVDKSEILKSFFNPRDPEFRRQRHFVVAVILAVAAVIVIPLVLTRDNPPSGPTTLAPTPAPTPEPTSEGLKNLTLFLTERASFDNGAALVDQTKPQYEAAKWLSNNANLDKYDEVQMIQRYILATLYFSTGGENWAKNATWLDDGEECGRWWQAKDTNLSCTTLHDVRAIELDGNGLHGTIPLELAFLSDSLDLISLRGNGLTGTIPTELAFLTRLKSLDVDDNLLSGTVMTELGVLTGLGFLGMFDNELSGTIPTEIFLLTKLSTLRLGNYMQGTIPNAIGTLSSLDELRLHSNRLTGPVPPTIGNLTRLTMLLLYDNELSGTIPSTCGFMSSLEVFDVETNRLVGTIPREVQNMTTLKELWLGYNGLSGSIHSFIGSLTGLEKLHLTKNNFTSSVPSEFGALVSMNQLALGRNVLTGTIPTELGRLKGATTLFLNENFLTGTIPTELTALTKLVHLSLRMNELSGTIPSGIHNMTDLHTLWLHGNSLTGPFTCPVDVKDCKVSCEFDNDTCRVLV